MKQIKNNKTRIKDKVLLFFILFCCSASAQLVTCTSFPKNIQLFVRNKNTNLATVQIAGSVNAGSGYTSVVLQLYKNNQLLISYPFSLNYIADVANFNFSIPINAELSKYTFKLLSNTNVVLKEANDVTAGDVYIITGQSNSVFNTVSPQTGNTFIITNNSNIFFNTNQNIGSIGYNFANQIVTDKQIPILVLNGGEAGKPIYYFQRDDTSLYNDATNYGRLLIRYTNAGFVPNDVTAIIWYQGESDGSNSKSYYLDLFNQLYMDWKQDYNPSHIYAFQVHSGCYIDSTSEIPESHRQLPQLYPDVQVISTNGALQGDTCHYGNTNGYNVLAERLFNLVNHDVYGELNTLGIYSPNITNCYYFPNQPKLTFELSPASDFYSFETGVHSDFFFENSTISILGGSVTGNKVTLLLSEPITTDNVLLSYLGRVQANVPYIKNQKGIGLLSFKNKLVSQSILTCFSNPNINSSIYFIKTLQGSHSYADANDDPEGNSIYQWYVADDAIGTNQTAIAGATTSTFTITSLQTNKYIGLGVIPKALTGITTGTEVIYYNPSPIFGAASFIFTGATQISNNFYTNRVMNTTDKISVSIDVSSPGVITFYTTTVNGYSFSKTGTYTIGTHNVVLTATGTQTTYNSGGDAFTITAVGATTETTTLTVNHVKLGANFTAHYNGITAGVSVNNLLATYTTGETFNNNGSCLSKPISASACVGTSLTVGSNTYPLVNINGQCWMQTNIKEISTAPCGQPINTGCNLLLAGQENNDTGAWGFYNTTTTNGTSGWATSEFTSGDGALYQWSAAMNGETFERAIGVCPTGFHIPSDCEWMYLEHGLGMSISQQTILGSIRSNTADNEGTPGYKLRGEGTGATNISGFSGKLTGSRATIGIFALKSTNGGYWTSTQGIGIFALRRNVIDGNRGVNRNTAAKQNSYGVRCLKD